MKEILAELYNKVVTFFQAEKTDNSKDIASNRLKLVLMHDRTKLDPLTLERMRNELIGVISRYVVIDQEQLELNLAGEGDSIALMLNIPVLRAKTEEELELQAIEDAKQAEQSEEETDEEIQEAEEDDEAQVEAVNDDSECSEDEEIVEAETENEEETEKPEKEEDLVDDDVIVEEASSDSSEIAKKHKKHKNK